MTFYNILYNKKSQAKSRRDGTAGFRPVKTVPDFIQLIFRNANAVVFHTDTDICAALLQRNTDIAAGMPVLDTIVDQIDKETGEKLGISLHDRGQHEILHIHTDLLFFGFFQQLIRGGFRYDLQIYLLRSTSSKEG